jgi:hypothetical protein
LQKLHEIVVWQVRGGLPAIRAGWSV